VNEKEPKQTLKPALVYAKGVGWIQVNSDEQYFRWLERWKEREVLNKKLASEYIRNVR